VHDLYMHGGESGGGESKRSGGFGVREQEVDGQDERRERAGWNVGHVLGAYHQWKWHVTARIPTCSFVSNSWAWLCHLLSHRAALFLLVMIAVANMSLNLIC